MGENTKIEWADHTFNPWVGCTKVSPACDHCYAEAWAKRTGAPELWNGTRRRTTNANWGKVQWWDAAARLAGVRRRVFCASLADVYDNQVPDSWRDDLFRLIFTTPHLDWLLLTKRPQNIGNMTEFYGGAAWPNIWFGTTAENDVECRRRVPCLQGVAARVRFLSCEPLLEPIEPDLTGIDWVICGGESGPGARDMDPFWARRLRDQCAEAGVAFFMKQMAQKGPIPADLMVRQFPNPDGTDLPARSCKVCGCTDDHACEGGCWWVEPNLCSACAPLNIYPPRNRDS